MISLSNIIKSPAPLNKKKVINVQSIDVSFFNTIGDGSEQTLEILEQTLKEKVKEAQIQADNIIAQAQTDYERVQQDIETQTENFKTKCQKAYEEQFSKGYKDGFGQGENDGKVSYQERIVMANHVVEKADLAYKEYLSQAESEILLLALKASETIIHSTLESEPDKWMHLVKKVVSEVREQETIKITVSPKWFELVTDHRKELAAFVQEAQLLIFVDEDLTDSQCYIETPFGKIDASVDSQLTVMKTKLLELMEDEAE